MSDQYVYFIQADENGPIKIGFTSDDPQKRLSQLQTGNASALKLIGAIKATSAREKQFHSAFAEWRLQGEWFKPHPAVLSGIQDALASIADSADCAGLHCSFCGICQRDTLVLIAGPDDIYICSQCVALCANIVSDQLDKTASKIYCGPLPAMVCGG